MNDRSRGDPERRRCAIGRCCGGVLAPLGHDARHLTEEELRRRLRQLRADADALRELRAYLADAGIVRASAGDSVLLDQLVRMITSCDPPACLRSRSERRIATIASATEAEAEAEAPTYTRRERATQPAASTASARTSPGVAPPRAPVTPLAPVAPTPVRSWIEIEVVGEDGVRLAGVRYAITLPDGTRHEGITSTGAPDRFDDLDPGRCTFTFPDLDDDGVELQC